MFYGHIEMVLPMKLVPAQLLQMEPDNMFASLKMEQVILKFTLMAFKNEARLLLTVI